MSQEITQLHKEVFEYLMEKRKTMPDLYFSLNTNISQLAEGLIFEGSNNSIRFTFWEHFILCNLTIDNLTKELVWVVNGVSINIIHLLKQKMNNSIIQQSKQNTYIKNYQQWQKGFDFFFKSDFDIINNCFKGYLNSYPKEKFEYQLNGVKTYVPYLVSEQNLEMPEINQLYTPKNFLYLNKLTLKNIGHFENITLDLSKKVTVLIGENGSGKSTILRTIALGLAGIEFFDLDKDLQRVKNGVLADFLRIAQYEKGEAVYSNEGEINLTINEETLQIILQPSALYKDKVNGEVGSGDRSVILNRKKFFNTLVIAFVQDANKYNPIADVTDIKPMVLDLLPMIRKVGQDTMKSLTNWLYYYVHEKNASKPIEKLFAIFSKIIGEEITLKQPYKTEGAVGNALGEVTIVITTPQNPEGINLDLVSQGYNNLFRWVGGILMRVYEYQQNFFPEKSLEEISGIVLIDEIDTYLHPKWQRNILKVLVEEFPNLQFVVTTHSPLVIGHLALWKNSNVFKIQNNEVVPKTHFYGRNPIDLLLEFYGVETRPKEIQEKIDNLYYAFEGENLYEAKQILAELTEILGADDAIVSEFTTSITLLEEIQ